jgi:hypothetical protein
MLLHVTAGKLATTICKQPQNPNFFPVCLRFKRTRWAGQTCMLTRNNQLV